MDAGRERLNDYVEKGPVVARIEANRRASPQVHGLERS